MAFILGIETSCDETAAAVFDTDGNRIISNTLFSQVELHAVYGGVVPEVASRSHVEKIHPIIQHALDQANITLSDLSAIAVTNKPGLAGSLLIGFCFAKGLAYTLNIPLITVNHLEGHIFSSHLQADGFAKNHIPYPYLAFSASGGHTALYRVEALGSYTEIGNTLDDAAGEAFDKIAKLIGLGYPGGPIIEKLATENAFQDIFHYPRTKQKPDRYVFSFSGLKTAILYDLAKQGYIDLSTGNATQQLTPEVQKHVASSLLVCIGDIFVRTIARVLYDMPELNGLSFVGGVACNKYLRAQLHTLCIDNKKVFTHAPPRFCTDNGAMIAFVGNYKYTRNEFANLNSDIFE